MVSLVSTRFPQDLTVATICVKINLQVKETLSQTLAKT
ncbi:hypothetical protein [Listeria phage LP-KV022]|uniref:Uncharacterized protein n=1 Tax=Listeria phage LP-KV022 TaxID=2178917 RepID=A0A5A4K5F3_9CAUD|nr:hypothetical protein [Listeria phage LP-KV022]